MGLPSDKEIVGFIAQNVQEHIPDAVYEREDGYLELNVDPIHWALVNATQELHGMCKMSEDQLKQMTSKNQEQDKLLMQYQREMASKAEKSELESLKDKLSAKEHEIQSLNRDLDELRQTLTAIKSSLCSINQEAEICK